jgi:hypothetical protein
MPAKPWVAGRPAWTRGGPVRAATAAAAQKAACLWSKPNQRRAGGRVAPRPRGLVRGCDAGDKGQSLLCAKQGAGRRGQHSHPIQGEAGRSLARHWARH